MSTPGAKTIYHLLGLLLALVVGGGLLLLVPEPQDAQAQVAPPAPPTVDKECTPNPVQVGQTLTCTIAVVPAPNTLLAVRIEDTLPAGLTVLGATSEIIDNFGGRRTFSCTVAGNTVSCPPAPQALFITNTPFFSTTFRATIEARADQCGTFQNTATAVVPTLQSTLRPAVLSNQRYQATAQITVKGCEKPVVPGGQQQQPVCPPVSQELGQEAESGNVSPSFDVTSSGNSSNQTAAPLQFGNTGNDNNAQGVLQSCGSQSGNAELEGGDMNFSPTLDASSNQGVGQSSGSSGQ
jgi:uncharacterized repeat protein (TIGR01451 family)